MKWNPFVKDAYGNSSELPNRSRDRSIPRGNPSTHTHTKDRNPLSISLCCCCCCAFLYVCRDHQLLESDDDSIPDRFFYFDLLFHLYECKYDASIIPSCWLARAAIIHRAFPMIIGYTLFFFFLLSLASSSSSLSLLFFLLINIPAFDD